MSIADKAVWVIERNSGQDLTLNAIAASCDVSRSHLASAFGTASGWPVMKYLKARRLSEAARCLASGAPDILTVALDFGYGSHEAFTRAFRDQFGTTPEQVRAAGSVAGLNMTPPLRLSRGQVRTPVPTLRKLGRFRAVGLSQPCSYGNTIGIPAQWQSFMAEHYEDITGKTETIPVGICQIPDDDGSFEYICAAEVTTPVMPRAPLRYIEVEPRTYAVFAHDEHVSTIFDTYTAIWNEALPVAGLKAADGPVLEFHNDAFDPGTGLGGLTIWIPLDDQPGTAQ